MANKAIKIVSEESKIWDLAIRFFSDDDRPVDFATDGEDFGLAMSQPAYNRFKRFLNSEGLKVGQDYTATPVSSVREAFRYTKDSQSLPGIRTNFNDEAQWEAALSYIFKNHSNAGRAARINGIAVSDRTFKGLKHYMDSEGLEEGRDYKTEPVPSIIDAFGPVSPDNQGRGLRFPYGEDLAVRKRVAVIRAKGLSPLPKGPTI